MVENRCAERDESWDRLIKDTGKSVRSGILDGRGEGFIIARGSAFSFGPQRAAHNLLGQKGAKRAARGGGGQWQGGSLIQGRMERSVSAQNADNRGTAAAPDGQGNGVIKHEPQFADRVER